MATVNKDFKIKSGLVVEGSNGTINGYDILTKDTSDQNYIIGLIGGSATSDATPDTVVLRDGTGSFAATTVTADLVGDVTGKVSDISNHSTTDLSEGTNKYFTNQRAIDANTGLWDTTGAAAAAQTAAEDYADGLISTEVTNRNSAIATAKGQAITAAEGYTDSAIGQEVLDRNSAISTAISDLNLSGTYDALGAAGAVQSNLDDHAADTTTHGVTGNIVGTTDAQTLSNKTLGSDLAAGGYKVSGLATPTANADAATKSYVDSAVSGLVDSAPELLNTLNELAAALGDDADFIGTVNAAIGDKVAKAGDSMSGDLDFGGTNKVTSLAAPTSNGDATNKLYVDTKASDALSAAKLYTDGEIADLDTAAQGYAADAQSAAETFATNADTTLHNTVTTEIATAKSQAGVIAQGYADTAEANAKTYAEGLDSTTNTRIDNLDTDDVAEGTSNLYFTTNRAKDAAIALLTGTESSLTNIQIVANMAGGVDITAENGVADSTTSDLAEGSNLYFTNVRAVDALEAVVPNFTEVDLNSVATQVAATTGLVATASAVTAYSFAKADYRSAKFLVKCAYGSHTELSEILLTLDSSDNIAMTEYAIVGTNGSSMSISADVVDASVRLRVTTVNNNSTVNVVGTLLA